MSLQRPISAAANSRAAQQKAAAEAAAATASASSTSAAAAAASKERALRSDPTLARSFRGHHGAVLSVAYSPVLVRAADTGLPGYASGAAEEAEIGGTVSSRARAQKAASSFVQQLASGGADHVVMLWHLRPQLRAFRFLGHAGPVNSVAFSADGKLLASASDDTTVRVWTPSAEGRSTVLRGHVKRVRQVAWSADNQWLLSASDDQQCKLWDVEAGVAHSHFHGHTQPVACCTFSPDMRLVATGSFDKTVKLFDLQTQSCLQTFYQNTAAVTAVKFHPFGSVLATGSADNSIKLWDVRSNQLLQHYSAHDLAVSSLDFHPSGNFLLSSSLDSSIRLWDLRRGHQLYTIHGHPSPVNSCQFNADGSAFVTGGNDQRVITWNTNLGDSATKGKRGGLGDFAASLPKVSPQQSGDAQQRGAMFLSQVAAPLHGGITGAVARNSVEAGRRDALYASEGIESGPVAAGGKIAKPAASGPLPPTEMAALRSSGTAGSSLASSGGRRGPPAYTFKTGSNAGQVIGGGHLYVDPSAPAGEGEEGKAACGPSCDYKHSHISATSGDVHSYGDLHDPALLAEAAARRAAKEARYPGGDPGLEHQPMEEQMRGFAVPGLTAFAQTGRASTRSGVPGPSVLQAPEYAAAAASASAAPSFAASAAGLQSNQVHPLVSARGQSQGQGPRQQDDYVYSFQSDRFIPASAHPFQAKTSEVVPLKQTGGGAGAGGLGTSAGAGAAAGTGVDIFAIPPADHVQRLPEQLAHTLKYMATQLDQITRGLQVFEYRMNVHEAKVERLEKQQARWSTADGY